MKLFVASRDSRLRAFMDKMKYLLPIAFSVVVTSASRASVLRTDTQVWSEIDLIAPVAPNLTATALAVSREGEGLPNPTLFGGGAAFDYRLGAWTFTVGDLEIDARSVKSGGTTDVNVPLGALSYSWSLGSLAFSEENRFERLYEVPTDTPRYRNKLSVEYPVTGVGILSNLFAADEVFYDLSKNQWSRNRAQLGLGFKMAEHASLQVYCMRQDDRFSVPSARNILGTTLKFDLQ